MEKENLLRILKSIWISAQHISGKMPRDQKNQLLIYLGFTREDLGEDFINLKTLTEMDDYMTNYLTYYFFQDIIKEKGLDIAEGNVDIINEFIEEIKK